MLVKILVPGCNKYFSSLLQNSTGYHFKSAISTTSFTPAFTSFVIIFAWAVAVLIPGAGTRSQEVTAPDS